MVGLIPLFAVETIEQRYFTVDPTRKFDLLERLLDRENPRQVIVFCRTKRGTDKVYEQLGARVMLAPYLFRLPLVREFLLAAGCVEHLAKEGYLVEE